MQIMPIMPIMPTPAPTVFRSRLACRHGEIVRSPLLSEPLPRGREPGIRHNFDPGCQVVAPSAGQASAGRCHHFWLHRFQVRYPAQLHPRSAHSCVSLALPGAAQGKLKPPFSSTAFSIIFSDIPDRTSIQLPQTRITITGIG